MASSNKHAIINMGRYFYNEPAKEYCFMVEDLGLTTDPWGTSIPALQILLYLSAATGTS
jgi:hypothetical protein